MPPLEGVRVVDLGHALGAPYCTTLLADHGADVVKVEPPSGDHFRNAFRGALMASINRNKRGIVVDLKTDGGKEVVRRLVAWGDVFVEAFVPGTIERLGFGYDDVKVINPRIIYASLSGFGQTGPLSDVPGYDVVAQAMSGIMMATGDPDRPPVRIGASLIDMGSGMYLALGVLLALWERERTGLGQRIDVSLLETAVSWVPHYIAAYSMFGDLPKRAGSGAPFGAPYRNFETKDGWVFIGVTTDRFWEGLCRALDLPDLESDERFGSVADRFANRDAIDDALAAHLGTRSTTEILERLRTADVPHGPVLGIDEVVVHPQIEARGLLHTMDHPQHGRVMFPKTPILRDGAWPEVRRTAPALGEHTREVLEELGYDGSGVASLVAEGAVRLR